MLFLDYLSHQLKKTVLLWLLCGLLLSGCSSQAEPMPSVGSYDSELATRWFDFYLTLLQETPGFTPPVASRAIGYAGVALYEAVVPGMPEYQSLAGQLNDLSALPEADSSASYHWPTVANSALAEITRELFLNTDVENKAKIEQLEAEFAQEYKENIDEETFNRSEAYGQAVGQAIHDWSLADGGRDGYRSNFPEAYEPPVGEGLWVPTPPDYERSLQPYWHLNRPFALQAADQCDPGPPPEYSVDPNSQFYAEAIEVYNVTRNATDEQKHIALYWADDPRQTPTPPGHALSIMTQVFQQEKVNLEVAIEGYAKMGIALADAFIGCWNTKYKYNLIRPLTYIQQVIDPTWNTPVVTDPVITPPFPEYTSGHSVQIGAAMQVLTSIFGDNYAITDRTHERLGIPARSFDSFFELANETALSRLYGGIHYRAAIELGVDEGKCIGNQVLALEFKKEEE